ATRRGCRVGCAGLIRVMTRSGLVPTRFDLNDDDDVRVSIAELWRSAGLPAETFATAREFLRRERGEGPTCQVLALQLHDMDGLDVQRELADSGDSMPIIFVTAHGDIPTTVRAMKSGAAEFLTKPFDDEQLLELI